MRPLLIALAISVATTACGKPSQSSDAGSDAGAADSGLASACGEPGQMGNNLGIGQFCMTTADCTINPGTLCSSIVNTDGGSMNTYVCVMPCSCTGEANICGDNASCVCDPNLGGCGCFPNSCSAFAQAVQTEVSCDAGMSAPMDAGHPDAGSDAGDDINDGG